MQPISYQIIREDILPQVQVIPVYSIVSGETRKMAFRMSNKYLPTNSQPIPSGWKVMVELTTKTGVLFLEAKINSCDNDNSIFTVDLDSEMTKNIINGKLIVWAISTKEEHQLELLDLTPLSSNQISFSEGKLTLINSLDLTQIEIGDYFLQEKDGVRTTFLITDIQGQIITLTSDAVIDLTADAHKIMRSKEIYKAVRTGLINKEKGRC